MDNFSGARSSVDRAVDFGSTGREFESLRAYHRTRGEPHGKVRYAAVPRLSPNSVATQWRHSRFLRFNQTLKLS
jgi:hypothetical protein